MLRFSTTQRAIVPPAKAGGMYEPNWTIETVTREDVDAMKGKVLLEFGADWCPHCQNVQTALEAQMGSNAIPHLKVTDGRGQKLGRSFRVKLWPNFVLLQDGQVQHQLARPSLEELEETLSTFLNTP